MAVAIILMLMMQFSLSMILEYSQAHLLKHTHVNWYMYTN